MDTLEPRVSPAAEEDSRPSPLLERLRHELRRVRSDVLPEGVVPGRRLDVDLIRSSVLKELAKAIDQTLYYEHSDPSL